MVSQVFSSRFQTLLTLIILWKSTCIEARAPFSLYIINIKVLLSKKYHQHGYFANWPPPKASPTVVQYGFFTLSLGLENVINSLILDTFLPTLYKNYIRKFYLYYYLGPTRLLDISNKILPILLYGPTRLLICPRIISLHVYFTLHLY